MRKKLYKNLTTLVLTFALAIGTLIGTTMDVMATTYYVDVNNSTTIATAKNTKYKPGDTLIFTISNLPSEVTYIFDVRTDCYVNSQFTGSILDYKEYTKGGFPISFPSDIEYGCFNTISVPSPSGEKIQHISLVVERYYSASPSESTSAASTELSATPSTNESSTPSHECNFQWVTTVEPQPGVDGLEEYKCVTCGAVKESRSIPANMATVKNLYGFIKDAPENGTVTTDFGTLHTISDYLLKKMAERSDATVTIQFEYKNQKLQITFPAGTDYTPVLNDTDTMYGFYGVAAKLGLTVTERQ